MKYKYNKKDKKKYNNSSHHHFKYSSCSKYGPGLQLDNYQVDKNEKGVKGVKVIKPLNAHFTAA